MKKGMKVKNRISGRPGTVLDVRTHSDGKMDVLIDNGFPLANVDNRPVWWPVDTVHVVEEQKV